MAGQEVVSAYSWKKKHAVEMVTHQSEANDERLSRHSFNEVLAIDKVCVDPGTIAKT